MTLFIPFLWFIWAVYSWVITINISKESNKTNEKNYQTNKESSKKTVKYKLETNTQNLIFIDWEEKEIKLKLTNESSNEIILSEENYNSEMYSYFDIGWVLKDMDIKKIIAIGKDNIWSNDNSEIMITIKSDYLEKSEWIITIQLKCKYRNDNLDCLAEWNKLNITYNKIDKLNLLWIDATKREDDKWNWDKIDLWNLIEYFKWKGANIKTMYSEEFYRNNKKNSAKNGNIILLYNDEKYSSDNPITKHIEGILQKYYGSYISWIDKYEYNEDNFKTLLSSLYDCNLGEKDKTKKCWESDLNFDKLTSENRFSKLFYDYNNKENIDFVFMIPAKVY